MTYNIAAGTQGEKLGEAISFLREIARQHTVGELQDTMWAGSSLRNVREWHEEIVLEARRVLLTLGETWTE